MENTGTVLFKDPAPQWFIALGKAWLGPLSAADVYAKVVNQEIGWAHYVWRKGQKGWQRICDTEPFSAAVPHKPSDALKEQVIERSREIEAHAAPSGARKGPPAPPRGEDDVDRKIWYLYLNETQFGPFSASEVDEYIAAGKAHARAFAWRDGMSGWQRLEEIGAFRKKLKTPTPSIRAATLRNMKRPVEDKRGTPRKPMVAKIYLSNDKDLAVAVCRDISIGGMQVLTDRIPGEVGGKVKLNVSPAAEEGKKPDFKPFVAEGSIVRLLEDGRGFSFRFHRLTEAARRSIEAYIQSSA